MDPIALLRAAKLSRSLDCSIIAFFRGLGGKLVVC